MATTPASDALVTVPPVQRRLLWTLGLGAFGLAFSITTTAAYLPPLLHRFTDSGGLIGVILGAEGIFALTVSPVVGPWSDSFHTPLGSAAAVHARRAGPDGVLPAADAVHAEPLDDGRDRDVVLLRLLPLRDAVPRALPGHAPPSTVRPLTGNPAHPARDRDRDRARRRRPPVQGLAAFALHPRLGPDDGRVRGDDPARAGGRGPRPRLRGLLGLHPAQLAHLLAGRGRTALPARQLGVGGRVRGGEDVRRPLHHRRAEPVEGAVVRACWGRSQPGT